MAANQLVLTFIMCLGLYILGALSSLITYHNPKLSNRLSNTFAVVASALLMFVMVYQLIFSNEILNFSLDTNMPFLSLKFSVDKLSAFFILIICLVSFMVSLFSYSYMSQYFYIRNIPIFGFIYNLFILSMILLTSSHNLLLFLVFWELMTLLSYFLVIYESEKDDVQKAGKMYLIMAYIGTAFITAAFIMISSFTNSFDFTSINSASIPKTYSNIIYLFLFIGFGTKAGIIPLHVWMPYTYNVAPSNISALMAGAMKKLSIYGLLRLVFDFIPNTSMWVGVVTLLIGSISAIFGIGYSVVSTTNIKRMLAYSSIENMGIIFCAIGTMLIAKSSDNQFLLALSLTATLLHTLNHAVFKSLLFMGAGTIHYFTRTRNIEKLGGLIKKMPIASIFIFIGCIAISAVPPFNGFVSEYMIFQAIINTISWFAPLGRFSVVVLFMIVAIVLALTGALVAFCFVKFFGISFLGKPRSAEAENVQEPDKPILLALGFSAGLCLLLGLFAKNVIAFIDNVNNELINLKLLATDWSLKSINHYPIENNNLNISVFSFTILILFFVGILSLIIMSMRKRTYVQKYNTWDCGFTKLNPKMQYSATGFSKSLSIVFRVFFKPKRHFVVTEGKYPYNIKKGIYTVSTSKVIEKYVYVPFVSTIINFSRRFRFKIQTGSIHTYLIYFFSILIFMLLYYSFAA